LFIISVREKLKRYNFGRPGRRTKLLKWNTVLEGCVDSF